MFGFAAVPWHLSECSDLLRFVKVTIGAGIRPRPDPRTPRCLVFLAGGYIFIDEREAPLKFVFDMKVAGVIGDLFDG